VSFGPRGNEQPDVLVGDSVLPLTRVMTDLGLPRTATLRSALPFPSLLNGAMAAALDRGDELIPVSRTRLGPPITDPPNLFACGASYFARLSEGALAIKSLPTAAGHVRQTPAGPARLG
jgi:hypothetical protein